MACVWTASQFEQICGCLIRTRTQKVPAEMPQSAAPSKRNHWLPYKLLQYKPLRREARSQLEVVRSSQEAKLTRRMARSLPHQMRVST